MNVGSTLQNRDCSVKLSIIQNEGTILCNKIYGSRTMKRNLGIYNANRTSRAMRTLEKNNYI